MAKASGEGRKELNMERYPAVELDPAAAQALDTLFRASTPEAPPAVTTGQLLAKVRETPPCKEERDVESGPGADLG